LGESRWGIRVTFSSVGLIGEKKDAKRGPKRAPPWLVLFLERIVKSSHQDGGSKHKSPSNGILNLLNIREFETEGCS